MPFLDWFKNLFKRKPEAEAPEDVAEPAVSETHAEMSPKEIKEVRKIKEPAFPGEREEKKCAKCGAPNDKFVHTCWLCKAEI